ncbi:hypothetical protein EVAR_98928_1 [Eumeta japonica]|uniref:Uncharacterized protein n=1 Tax=Eumeta variegata TaxID=151549 RepID=A0A4C2A392_EUMVA|nr:hypothetical protein EVAR_98928_1 [Eumeta japonica]
MQPRETVQSCEGTKELQQEQEPTLPTVVPTEPTNTNMYLPSPIAVRRPQRIRKVSKRIIPNENESQFRFKRESNMRRRTENKKPATLSNLLLSRNVIRIVYAKSRSHAARSHAACKSGDVRPRSALRLASPAAVFIFRGECVISSGSVPMFRRPCVYRAETKPTTIQWSRFVNSSIRSDPLRNSKMVTLDSRAAAREPLDNEWVNASGRPSACLLGVV